MTLIGTVIAIFGLELPLFVFFFNLILLKSVLKTGKCKLPFTDVSCFQKLNQMSCSHVNQMWYSL